MGTLDAPIKAAPKAGVDIVEVTGSVVNLRTSPLAGAKVLARLKRGVRAELVTKAADGRVQIRELGTGTVGFMSADFLAAVTPG